eukprot:CAMPEP_0177364808 /NCGR_PEP_ID=MMETSP0368-20130122/38981_1 /TAXON_ID=447022 ORGANISM="Scrippsiella hangoei-like, Strain SHHI-4" /NCGR_SAMPLE_ID=MMETSP0368 /ASSEMBLY_ACC=CAM_ASM_000363 /LENGTH=461 /DNA_ID=CAMNT_0018827681 /DNA_START=6 /DNA_END=1391 /DNA_ORIENTATION=+
MGNSYSGYEPVYASKKDGTTLIEVHLKHLQDAHGIVGLRPQGNFTPVVLSPQNSMIKCCIFPCFCVAIPSGFSAIVTKFGAVVNGDEEDETWSPGCHCFSPLYSVDKLVSRQLITFDTPIKDCKTANFITVNLDVMLQFEIIRAKDFVFKIGAEKFDDYLRASQDEALRTLANQTELKHIFDLCGQNTDHIVQEMNAKFDQYGVKVHNFTVKNVRIPQEMAADAEEKTLFDSKTTRDHMKQKFDRQRVQIDEAKKKLKEECDNHGMAAEQQAEVVKNQAMKETAEVVSRTSRDIQELEANRDNDILAVVSTAELQDSKQKAQILALEREMNSKTQAECARIRAEAQAYAKQQETDAKIEVAQKMANGKQALSLAEGESSEAFALRRAHQAELKRLDILQEVTLKPLTKIATSQENTVGLNADNMAVTQVAQQGLEALRAKFAEVTATSLHKLEYKPLQQAM